MLLSIILSGRTSSPVGSAPAPRIWIYASLGPRLQDCPLSPPAAAPAHSAVSFFTAERPVVLPLLLYISFSSTNPVSLCVFRWPSVRLAFSSVIVNDSRMRPHSDRPLQHEDGVGGSQRRAASSGTNTGYRRPGECRRGKTRGGGGIREDTEVNTGVVLLFLFIFFYRWGL